MSETNTPENAAARSGKGDLAFGLTTAVLAVLFAWFGIPSGVESPANVTALPLSPAFLPYIATGMIFLFGLLHALEAAVKRRLQPPITSNASDPRHPSWVLRATVVLACFLAYLYLPAVLGMAGVSILVTAGLMLLAGERSPLILIGGSVVLPLLVYVFFTRVAQVPLPLGLFE